MGAIFMVYWPLLVLPCVAALEDGSSFALNIFSDIAPIISLFGEQFATQYLSQSRAWYDHVIFAMVPIGIVTIIIGVIRVSGPKAVKAFIGRAREGLAMAELELMSSISPEVCEVFDKHSIIRAMGKSKVAHFLIYPSKAEEFSATKEKQRVISGIRDDHLPFRIHTLKTAMKTCVTASRKESVETAMETGVRTATGPAVPITSEFREIPQVKLLTKEEYKSYDSMLRILHNMRRILHSSNEGDPEAQQRRTDEKETSSKNQHGPEGENGGGISEADAPDDLNIQLNLTRHTVLEAWVITTLAIIIQLGLLAIAGASALYSPVKNATGFEPERYALPCYLAGSFSLSVGVGLCSYVIGESTKENIWRTPKKTKDRERPYLFFIQKAQSVQDMEFGPYVIRAGQKADVLTSRRRHEKTSDTDDKRRVKLKILSTFGAVMTGSGFIVQYIGLRGLSYPCAVAHLGATLAMAGLRAHFRRKIGHGADNMEALARFELIFLATYVVFSFSQGKEEVCTFDTTKSSVENFIENWKVMRASRLPAFDGNAEADSPNVQQNSSQLTSTSISQQIVWARKRMGDLCEWESQALEIPLVLGRSIETFVKYFHPTKTDKFNTSDKVIYWNVPISSKEENDEFVTIKIKQNEFGAWKADIGELEAIMSLWMASVSQNQKNAEEQDGEKPEDWRRTKSGPNSRCDYVVSLGPNPDRRLERDLRWWVDGLPPLQTRQVSDGPPHPESTMGPDTQEGELWIGHSSTFGGLYCEGTGPIPRIMAHHLFTLFLSEMAAKGYLAPDCLRQKESDIEMTNSHLLDPSLLHETWYRPLLHHRKLTEMVQEMESLGLGSAADIFLCIIPVFSSYDLLPNHIFLQHFCNASFKFNWEDTLECYIRMVGAPMGIVANEKTIEQFAYAMVARVLDLIELVVEPYEKDSFKTFQETQPSIFTALKKLVSELNTGYQHIVDHLALVLMVQGRAERFKFIFERCKSPTNMQSPPPGEGLEEFIARGKMKDYSFCFYHMQKAVMFSDLLAFVIIILWDGMGNFEKVSSGTIKKMIRKALDDTKSYVGQWSNWEAGESGHG